MRSGPPVVERAARPSATTRRSGEDEYFQVTGIAEEYLDFIEMRARREAQMSDVPGGGTSKSPNRLVFESRYDLAMLYVDLWRAVESKAVLSGWQFRECLDKVGARVGAKRILHSRDLESAGVRLEFSITTGDQGNPSTAEHPISLWTSATVGNTRKRQIMLFLVDASDSHWVNEKTQRTAVKKARAHGCGLYEVVSGASRFYHLVNLFSEIRTLWEYDVGSNFSLAADAACLEYLRVTGHTLDRQIVWRALQAMAATKKPIYAKRRNLTACRRTVC